RQTLPVRVPRERRRPEAVPRQDVLARSGQYVEHAHRTGHGRGGQGRAVGRPADGDYMVVEGVSPAELRTRRRRQTCHAWALDRSYATTSPYGPSGNTYPPTPPSSPPSLGLCPLCSGDDQRATTLRSHRIPGGPPPRYSQVARQVPGGLSRPQARGPRSFQ